MKFIEILWERAVPLALVGDVYYSTVLAVDILNARAECRAQLTPFLIIALFLL